MKEKLDFGGKAVKRWACLARHNFSREIKEISELVMEQSADYTGSVIVFPRLSKSVISN
jgi:hypothetical protein